MICDAESKVHVMDTPKDMEAIKELTPEQVSIVHRVYNYFGIINYVFVFQFTIDLSIRIKSSPAGDIYCSSLCVFPLSVCYLCPILAKILFLYSIIILLPNVKIWWLLRNFTFFPIFFLYYSHVFFSIFSFLSDYLCSLCWFFFALIYAFVESKFYRKSKMDFT